MNKVKSAHTSKQNMIIVGCGQIGTALVELLEEDQFKITIIDKDDTAFHKLSPRFNGLVLNGDATDHGILKKAKIQEADIVIAVTDNDDTNFFVARVAKEIYCVAKVIARLCDLKYEQIYQKFEMDIICPSLLSAQAIREEVKT